MTDKEMLIHLCERLGLERSDDTITFADGNDYVVANEWIRLGTGKGYRGFHATFVFDKDGNIVHHGIWE